MVNNNFHLEDSEFCKTLQETSWDKYNQQYCCNNRYNNKKVCSFDDFKSKYIRNDRIKSVDALCKLQDSRVCLIEFKNGNVKSKEVLQKVYDSVVILSRKLDKPITYFANKYIFVLVYNQAKLQGNSRSRRALMRFAAKKTGNKSYKIGFDLEQLEGYLCNEVITISKCEFNKL